MGLFSTRATPASPPPPRVDMLATSAAACIVLCAMLCVYGAWRARAEKSSFGSSFAFQAAGMLVNIIAVSIPGRFDSDVDPKSMSFPWPTLFAPAGFAFAIWGVIYLGEVAGIAVLALKPEIASVAASRSWAYANAAQALWCLSFRPWALDKLWLSSACLAATAVALVLSQARLLVDIESSQQHGALLALVAWPRSLHAGWVTAATLVNVNAWVGMEDIGPARAFATAIMSVGLATAIASHYAGLGIKCAAFSIAWALFAVSRGVPNGRDALALGPVALDGFATVCAVAAATIVATLVIQRAS